MTPSWQMLHGDALTMLRTLPDESVQSCVTSPPYWGLRDYGIHGQIGLERTPDEYVAKLVAVFREVRRVLHPTGVLWCNLGDCYATGAGKVGDQPGGGAQGARWKGYRGNHTQSPKHSDGAVGPLTQPNRLPIPGLKPKDLVGVPWRVAFALQADGWYLRSDVVWAKPNPMPESVTDRPTKSHEFVFLLAKSQRYYFDQEAVREPHGFNRWTDTRRQDASVLDAVYDGAAGDSSILRKGVINPFPNGGRNIRTVWTIATAPYAGAHFATWPAALVEPCIKAGSSERGCCPQCGAPWERLFSRTAHTDGRAALGPRERNRGDRSDGFTKAPSGQLTASVTLGWRPTCEHAGHSLGPEPVPCTVLDPFAGSGTTGAVALTLGRSFVGIELNETYIAELATPRLEAAARDADDARRQMPLITEATPTRPTVVAVQQSLLDD